MAFPHQRAHFCYRPNADLKAYAESGLVDEKQQNDDRRQRWNDPRQRPVDARRHVDPLFDQIT